LFIVFFSCTEASEKSDKANEAWAKLRAQRKISLLPELTVSIAQLVLFRAPRNYSLILFFSSKEQNCHACRLLERPLKKISSIIRGTDIPVFIYNVDINERALFEKLQVQQLPSLFHIGPGRSEAISIKEEDKYVLKESTVSHDYMVGWINARAGVHISLPQSWVITMMNPVMYGSAFTVFLGVFFFAVAHPTSSYLWFTFSLLFYFACQAGVVWNLIRHPPMMGFNPSNDEPQFISQSAQQQYIIEGLIVGFTNSLVGVSLIAMSSFAPKIHNRWLQRFFFLIVLGVFCYALYTVSQLFCIKHPYYPYCLSRLLNL